MKTWLMLFALLAFTAGCSKGAGDNSASSGGVSKQMEADYDLQERCGKRAEQVFKSRWGTGYEHSSGMTVTTTYSNHYNSKLNKCFYEVVAITFFNKSVSQDNTLRDVNENRVYGIYSDHKDNLALPGVVLGCQVQGVACKSKDEWDVLAKPLMSE